MKSLLNKLAVIALLLGSLAFAGTTQALEYQGRLIRLGTQGPDVQELQQCLLDMGFDLPVYGADGWYGQETSNQITSYQIANNLKVDGIVGPQTAGSLTCEPEQEYELQLAKIDSVLFSKVGSDITLNYEGTLSSGCYQVQDPLFNQEGDVIVVTINDKVLGGDMVCIQAEEDYELEAVYDSSSLDPGAYRMLVNGEDDFDYDFIVGVDVCVEGDQECINTQDQDLVDAGVIEDNTDSEASQEVGNTTASIQPSTDGEGYVATFSFRMNLSPFEDPIYVPVVAEAAGEILLYLNGEPEPQISQEMYLSSGAEIIEGNDGNDYYLVKKPEIFTFVSQVRPGEGEYSAYLKSVSFTSQDVKDRDYETFVGVRLDLNEELWSTDAVELEN